MPANLKLEEMTSPEIRAAIDQGMDTVVFAVGSNEQHGPMLPVCTDTAIGDAITHVIVQKLGNSLKGPTIPIGCSDHHMKFAGTISLQKETLQNVIKDYVASMAQHGFQRIIIIPFHGGNFIPLAEIKEELQTVHSNIQVLVYTDMKSFIEIMHESSTKLEISKQEAGSHAGQHEVSEMMWIRGELVKTDNLSEAIGFVNEFTDKKRELLFKSGIDVISPIGVLGDPTKASIEHGKIYTEDLASALMIWIKKGES